MGQEAIDQRNALFWDELCGTSLANMVGATGRDAASLDRYDRAFFEMYPYLDRIIQFDDTSKKKVLEIGLGYGSMSQLLARGGTYTGLDIARGPVDMVNHRIGLCGYQGSVARQGSALKMPFEDNSFDAVVSIGCLHATGNLRKAIQEVHRVLRPQGRATIMVYNAASYFRWIKNTKATARYVLSQARGSDEPLKISDAESAVFDKNAAGIAAPEATLTTKTTLRRLMKDFSSVHIERTNVARHSYAQHIPRNTLNAIVGPLFGLDLYATAIK